MADKIRSPYDSSVILQEEALNNLISLTKNYLVGGKGTGVLLVPSNQVAADGTVDQMHVQIQNAIKYEKGLGGFYTIDASNDNKKVFYSTTYDKNSNTEVGFQTIQESTSTYGTFQVRTITHDTQGIENPPITSKIKIYGFTDSGDFVAPGCNINVSGGNTSTQGIITGNKVRGAVFNDYAEYRESNILEAGYCVIETGKGNLIKSTERLQLGANIISDTFGFSIGETETAKTPIAVCGRVLAYPFEDVTLYTPGAAVCSGPDGKISLMTREEIKEWPDAIVGYVSEIPNYETWGSENINVNGRIWIKIK